MSDTEIQQNVLSEVSARTLAKKRKADAGQRVEAIDAIKEGKGFPMSNLSKMLRKAPVKKNLDDLLAQDEEVVSKKTDSEKVQGFTVLAMENAILKQKVKVLEVKPAKAKTKA